MAPKPGRYGIDPDTGYPLCKRGHVRSPENLYGEVCRKCRKQYRESEQGRAAIKKYEESEKRRAAHKRYEESEKGGATRKRYQGSEKGRTLKKRYTHRMADGYIARRLNIPVALATPELIEIKRLSIQLHRSLKNANQIRSHHIDNGECTGSTGRRAAARE